MSVSGETTVVVTEAETGDSPRSSLVESQEEPQKEQLPD